jgi:hypothetical protein
MTNLKIPTLLIFSMGIGFLASCGSAETVVIDEPGQELILKFLYAASH